MNYINFGFLLVSLLTTQITGSPLQPTDLSDNATELLTELDTRANDEVNVAFSEIWTLPENLTEAAARVVSEGIPKVQTTIDEVFQQLHQFRNESIEQGLDFDYCQDATDEEINDYYQKVKLGLRPCATLAQQNALNAINYAIAELNNLLSEVTDLKNQEQLCQTDKCYLDIIDSTQRLLDQLTERVEDNREIAVQSAYFGVKTINKCTPNGNLQIKITAQLLTKTIKECLSSQ